MALEASVTVDTTGDLTRGDKIFRSGQTLLQDVGRVADLKYLTVMAQQASSLKWIPLTAVASTVATGEGYAAGLYYGDDVPTADLVAGDVTSSLILVGKSVEIDESKIVLENALTLDTVVTALGKTIRQMLSENGIYARPTEYFQTIQPIA